MAAAIRPRPSTAPALQVTLRGRLRDDAEVRMVAGTNVPTITAMVEQPGGAPVRVVEYYGNGFASHHAAVSKARMLRRGTTVEVRGEGLAADPKHRGALSLTRVSSLAPLHIPTSGAMAAANDHEDSP